VDQVKEDIQERFTRRYLYSPTEYYGFRLDNGGRDTRQQASDKGAERTGNQEQKFRSGKSRDNDDYER
jgi:hypothetical protein